MPGKFNPADLVSKPQPIKEYIDNKFWTPGPSFLQQENNDWIDKYTLEDVIHNNILEIEVNDYQTEFKPLTEANNFNSKSPLQVLAELWSYVYTW